MNHSPRFALMVLLLVVGTFVHQGLVHETQRQAPAKPATAARPSPAPVVLAITRCGQLAGYLAVYPSGNVLVLPPLQAKPGTKLQAIDLGEHCDRGAVL